MRADLEELSYTPETIKSMTPVQASLVLTHSLPPIRYETEIDALMMKEDLARASMAGQTKDDSNGDDASSSLLSEPLLPDEPRNDKETPQHDDESSSSSPPVVVVVVEGETTSITTTSSGRLWYEVIEQPENGQKDEPYILGLFLQEHEALACQKVHEELAVKKGSRSTFATRATTKP